MDTDSYSSPDIEIIHQVVSGDVNAFEILLKRYQAHVVGIVKKHVPLDRIEEVAQEVFFRAYKSLSTFKRDDGFKQWLSTITIRTCYDFWRKHYRHREIPLSSLSEKHQVWLEEAASKSSSESFYERVTQEEAREILDWALERLSPEDRIVLELVYLEGYSVKEAADLLSWSTVNVKVRSFRARKRLHKLLKDMSWRRRE